MFPELIGLIRSSRSFAERAHLAATNDAAHRALGAFYESVTDKADELVEVYQGRVGRIIDIPVVEESDDLKNPAVVLRGHLAIIEGVREAAVGNDSPIQNIVDELCGIYLRTLYKLEQLK